MAASNILRVIFTLVNIFVWATGSVTNALVGNLYGQNRLRDSGDLLQKLLKIGFGGTLILTLLAYISKPGLLVLLHANTEILHLVNNPYWVILFEFNIGIATNICFNALLATHSGARIIAIEIFTIILYCLYAYLVCNYWQLSLSWIWSSEILYALLLGGLSAYYFRRYYQKNTQNAYR